MSVVPWPVRVVVGGVLLAAVTGCSSSGSGQATAAASKSASTTIAVPATATTVAPVTTIAPAATTASSAAATTTAAATSTTTTTVLKGGGNPAGWVLVGGTDQVTISGVVKSLEQPFTINVVGPAGSSTATGTPIDASHGTIAGSTPFAGSVIKTTGDYHLTKSAAGYDGSGTITSCLVVSNSCATGAVTFTLTPSN